MVELQRASGRSRVVPADETFDGTWPYGARYTDAPGFRMHYVDEGEGETLLLLHGEPTWGYLFRHLIAALSPHRRVVVPDHMGFGKSETPADRRYLLQDHVDNLERFVLELELTDLTLVMHDFGGPVGMGLAIRHPDRIRRIISTNGPTPLGQPDLGDVLASNAATSPWFRWIAAAHADGTLAQVLGQLDYNMLSTLKLNGFERHDVITESWLRAYRAPFPVPESCLGAIGWAAGFAEGAHRFETADAVTIETLSRKPALAIWGMADRTLRADAFLPLFAQAFPDGLTHRLEKAGHYCHEDAPTEITPPHPEIPDGDVYLTRVLGTPKTTPVPGDVYATPVLGTPKPRCRWPIRPRNLREVPRPCPSESGRHRGCRSRCPSGVSEPRETHRRPGAGVV